MNHQQTLVFAIKALEFQIEKIRIQVIRSEKILPDNPIIAITKKYLDDCNQAKSILQNELETKREISDESICAIKQD